MPGAAVALVRSARGADVPPPGVEEALGGRCGERVRPPSGLGEIGGLDPET